MDNQSTIEQEGRSKGVWDKAVAVEESAYYWRGEPILKRGLPVNTSGPVAIELFSGCGGTSLGFEMAGYHIALGADIHKPSVTTFAINHPKSATILGDIARLSPQQLIDTLATPRVDVLIAGIPCQGFSLNNRKRHAGDKRNLLYVELLRFIDALDPKCIVIENVSGMRSSGDFARRIEQDLAAAAKMSVRSSMLNAHEFGVPQKRQRLVFVGLRHGAFDFDSLVRTHGPIVNRPHRTVRDAIGDLPSLAAGESSHSYATSPQTEYQAMMRGDLRHDALTNHRAPRHPPETIAKIAGTIAGSPIYPAFKQRIRLSWDQPSPTQVSGGIRPQFQFGHPSDARGLTIRERCRIQSFPDTFEVSGGIVQGRVQTGNAVPPLMARALAEALRAYI